MKKHTRIGLMVLVTVVLLLALVMPALAKKGEFPASACYVMARVIDDDDVIDIVPLHGELVAYWSEGTLYNYCTGIYPWGETLTPYWRYLTFDEACEYFEGVATCTKNIISIQQEDWPGDIFSYDPETGWRYYSTDSLFEARRSSGKFLWYKV